ncbi:Cell death protease [Cladophialophora chaetospira]|uniref:Pheromone-processing carboxypeptidase KEX1 n=1 Tax=Cladophialophora chaetospira TaxID=386627 RepID=A0AA39CLU2_9EURO|nr:Cell death protease [Cladophialophora chaetospira]
MARVWTICALLFMAFQARADKTAADYYVHSLPGAPDGPLLKMHAGHIEINPEHNGHLFFWHYQNRHIADRPRTVIWLNGGPGCSSMDGALMELGPYRVKDGGKLEYNEGSWDEFANVLFVDQPVGTGFSYVNTDSYVHELEEMANQFLVFMDKWFDLFPQYEDDDLYFAGESYAGQYIPYIAKALLDRNKRKRAEGKRTWNLTGLLIGNGWISPVEQYQAYLPFAYQTGMIQGGTPEAAKVEAQQTICISELGKPGGSDRVDVSPCEAVLSLILEVSKVNGKCYNMYDIRLQDNWPSCGMAWPPDLETVTPYLRQQNVLDALHINPDKRTGWVECAGAVSSAFRARNSKPSIQLVPGILEAGVPILLFSGASDMICNHLGTEELIASMQWSGGKGMERAPQKEWEFEGEAAGIYQEARNLTYVKFYNSSHMVPFDYPRRTRDMLDRFMGVDIASIGGQPADSRLEGEKAGPETSVGGYPNSTAAIEDEEEKVKEAQFRAYYRSGEAALVFVIIAAALFGFWVWRGRRKARGEGYLSLPLVNGSLRKGRGDVEAGGYEDNELDNLESSQRNGNTNGPHYDLASDSEDEDKDGPRGDGKAQQSGPR